MIGRHGPSATGKRSFYDLVLTGIDVIRNEGWATFWTMFKRWCRQRISLIFRYEVPTYARRLFGENTFKDILFISGCPGYPARYRVEHKVEQLEFHGFTCDHIWYENLSLDKIKYYRGFVFYRCLYTPVIEQFIAKAKYFNKKSFYDIDDLVIDEKYVKDIKHLKTMSKYEFDLYMDGVNRMRKTLQLCDYAITPTSVLARELKNYMGEVFINRNVASEEMVRLSQEAIRRKGSRAANDSKVYLGYLSGSITHNHDLELVLPVLTRILKENPNVCLVIVGIIDVPAALYECKEQLIIRPFIDWRKLPQLIATLDVNLAPMEQSTFNEAKSENKWTEASLVEVLTVASRVGGFAEVIEDGVTGLLCSSETEWYDKLSKAIKDEAYRCSIARNAYVKAMKEHVTAYTGRAIANFIESKLNPNIGFVAPSINVSGGINVLIKHCNILRKHGYDVTFISMGNNDTNFAAAEGEVNVVSLYKTNLVAYFEKLVASMWTTRAVVDSYSRANKKYYLVQNFETDFYLCGDGRRKYANMTYGDFPLNINYITISTWCQDWLKTRFGKTAKYAPNGIELSLFKYADRNFDGKIRILIEGDSESYYKNVDESFTITNSLDSSKFEVWYLSYEGKPKNWYRVDRFFNRVPYAEVAKIYQQCHLLVKSSILEGFSLPPLEMMATGGIAIVTPNGGNVEYLRDRENCVLYEPGNIEQAIKLIHEVLADGELRSRLIKSGLETAQSRSWENVSYDIVRLYE